MHREGLKHRAIHVLVFNARGEIFLQKRSMTKDTFPGAWDSSASGHLDSGEDYDACAVRELREEFGLVLARAAAPPFQNRGLRRNRPGICLGLSAGSRGARFVAPRKKSSAANGSRPPALRIDFQPPAGLRLRLCSDLDAPRKSAGWPTVVAK